MKWLLTNLLLFLVFISWKSYGQDTTSTRKKFTYHVTQLSTKITIDGKHDPGEWEGYAIINTLHNHQPIDKGEAKNKTEIKITYDTNFLYLTAKMYDSGKRTIQSLQRDSYSAIWDSDSFIFTLDPINKKQSGFIFAVNAAGAEMDGNLLIEPSRTTYRETWDERWFSSVKQYDDYWIAEFAIPFTSVRYNENNLDWGINFIRRDITENLFYTWTQFPLNFENIDVNYMGTLKWDQIPEVTAKTFFLKPYITTSSFQENSSAEGKADSGLDFKTTLTKSITLDATINPDFSNADVDLEVTNITRFNIFLPERRDFFIENGDIFSNFGGYSVRPFFSRRIGLVNGRSSPIIFGAKVTGNPTDKLRAGIMNVQTRKDEGNEAQNYTVGAFQWNPFGRSQIKGLFINRQETGTTNTDFNRTFGGEFTFVSKKGNFNSTAMIHSTTDENNVTGNYIGISGSYINRNFGAGWGYDRLDKNYQSDLGIVPRLFNYNADTDEIIRQGYTHLSPWARYKFFPKNSKTIISHGPRIRNTIYLTNSHELFERFHGFSYDFDFRDTSFFTISAFNTDLDLQFPTNFLGSQFSNLPKMHYSWWAADAIYYSDRRAKLTYSLNGTYGGFYNGNRLSINMSSNLRFGYWGNFGLSYNYNGIHLPENYGSVDLHLFRFTGRIGFSNKLFFNNTIQYNSQSTNFSIFSRLQWRYAPLSDLFLIYNQNNDTNGFELRNRSIMLKLTYRFAI